MALEDVLDGVDAGPNETAERMSRGMPLVHFPAGTALSTWSTWGALRPPAALGRTAAAGVFGALRNDHVFAYAGPCCFPRSGHIGDSVLYLRAGADDGARGKASPFDTGALEPPAPRLQPVAAEQEPERWRFVAENSVELASWRPRFAAWLGHCYDSPDRYLDTGADRYADGCPDRTIPAELREHNGPRGRERYSEGSCADRRAWTWEVRLRDPLPFTAAAVLHCTYEAIEVATRMRASLREQGVALDIVPLGRRPLDAPDPISADAFYRESGPLIRERLPS